MIKTGKVTFGKTPSIFSGRPAEVMEEDEPVCEDEQPAVARTLVKMASAFAAAPVQTLP